MALVAMLMTAFVPQALASWQCEGRTCGTTLWFCCCIAPEGTQDPNCADTNANPGGSGSLNCPSECNCTLTVTSAENSQVVATVAASFLFDAPAIAPQVSRLTLITPTEILARSLQDRGPPAPKVCFATPALRGPPSLTFPTFGS